MKERTLKEIEDEIDSTVPTGNIGKVMDLVDEHGNTYDKMHYAIEKGDLKRVMELEKLGVSSAESRFVMVAVKYEQNLIVFHQVKQGASLKVVIELAKEYNKASILNWARYVRNNKMGSDK